MRGNWLLSLVVGMAWLGSCASSLMAGTVNLDTGAWNATSAPWQVTRTLIGGESVPNPNGDSAGTSYTWTHTTDVSNPAYPNWIAASSVGDGLAKWVSYAGDTGSFSYAGDTANPLILNDGTSYVYAVTFTLSSAATARLQVSGSIAADNVISGLTLFDDTASSSVPLNVKYNNESLIIYYRPASTFTNAGPFTFSGTHVFTLTADVVNWSTDPSGKPYSTGFILDGTASTIPEPATLSLLAILVGVGLFRRRRCDWKAPDG